MAYSPKTTICGLVICLVILLEFVNWGAFTAQHSSVLPEVAKILIAVFTLLLGFFSHDEPHH